LWFRWQRVIVGHERLRRGTDPRLPIRVPVKINLLHPEARAPIHKHQRFVLGKLQQLGFNWLQVFKRAHPALLGSGGGPEHRTNLVPSEKWAGGWGSDDDAMRMITASFIRAIGCFAGALCLHFLPLFQQVVAIRKTCNQLNVIN
jgi:hypothetical protein